MEDIDKRLRDSTDACIKSFENWIKQNRSSESRESLMETVHEVRKVIARVEIEIAISERDRLGARPLPIPPHRSQRKAQTGDDMDMGDDDQGFDMPQAGPAPRQHDGQGRRPHGGGRGGDRGENRGRRPMQGGRGPNAAVPSGNGNGNEAPSGNGGTTEGQPS